MDVVVDVFNSKNNMLIREILEQIRNTASSNDKRAIFDANKSELLELVFTDTYDKSRNYYVKKYDKTYAGPGNLFDGLLVADALTIDNDYHIFHELLLLKVHQTNYPDPHKFYRISLRNNYEIYHRYL